MGEKGERRKKRKIGGLLLWKRERNIRGKTRVRETEIHVDRSE